MLIAFQMYTNTFNAYKKVYFMFTDCFIVNLEQKSTPVPSFLFDTVVSYIVTKCFELNWTETVSIPILLCTILLHWNRYYYFVF